MNAASAHQIWVKDTVAPPILQNASIPMQTKLAAHMAIMLKIQSKPPITIPFTGYASPLKTCVNNTAGKIMVEASRIAALVVKPRRMESLWRKVVKDRVEATPPPKTNDVLIK
mmetsp:Transcript_254/g.619  ORF Transcript_254/g.619 Transcript_254/m.619 type:complete len:113 (+) Transcript_254:2126-2464(+)